MTVHPLLKEAVSGRDEPLKIESVTKLVIDYRWQGHGLPPHVAVSVPRVKCLEQVELSK